MLYLGIDPGLNKTGVGIVDGTGGKLKYVTHRLLTTKPKDSLPDRLGIIVIGINEIVKEFDIKVAAIENIFYSNNPKSALLLGQTRGAIIAALCLSQVEVVEYTALQIKKAITGYGQAGKDQIKRMVELHLNLVSVKKFPLDITDSLAVAICLAYNKMSGTNLK